MPLFFRLLFIIFLLSLLPPLLKLPLIIDTAALNSQINRNHRYPQDITDISTVTTCLPANFFGNGFIAHARQDSRSFPSSMSISPTFDAYYPCNFSFAYFLTFPPNRSTLVTSTSDKKIELESCGPRLNHHDLSCFLRSTVQCKLGFLRALDSLGCLGFLIASTCSTSGFGTLVRCCQEGSGRFCVQYRFE